MTNRDPFYISDSVRLNADKAFVTLESVISTYFDTEKPDLDAFDYDYKRILIMLNIVLDYIQNIQDTVNNGIPERSQNKTSENKEGE